MTIFDVAATTIDTVLKPLLAVERKYEDARMLASKDRNCEPFQNAKKKENQITGEMSAIKQVLGTLDKFESSISKDSMTAAKNSLTTIYSGKQAELDEVLRQSRSINARALCYMHGLKR